MILNEMQIMARLLEEDPDQRIVIIPIIDAKTQFQPASIDLRLGTDFKVIKNVGFEFLDLLKEETGARLDIANYTERIQIPYNGKFVLHPEEFALGCTLEYVKLPRDIAGRLEGRSTWGRAGLQIHATAGFVDPGFSGSLTFELQNVGKVPIPLFPGLRVAQISFYALKDSKGSFIPYTEKPYHKYGGRVETVGALYYKEPEISILRKIHKEKRT
ncbi:dCTP deaminase [Candidatus Gottesmanbacteria bacterium]|nr:dCTP deaminase [Candidatus Gottesmanbacteria bacterium]